jgi:hypothetical protein
MLSLIVETFRPWALVALLLAQWFCIAAGLLMLLTASAIHSGLGAAESLVFLVPAVFLTALRRIVREFRL